MAKMTVVVTYAFTDTRGNVSHEIVPFTAKTEDAAQRLADAWVSGMQRSYPSSQFEVLVSRTFAF